MGIFGEELSYGGYVSRQRSSSPLCSEKPPGAG